MHKLLDHNSLRGYTKRDSVLYTVTRYCAGLFLIIEQSVDNLVKELGFRACRDTYPQVFCLSTADLLLLVRLSTYDFNTTFA